MSNIEEDIKRCKKLAEPQNANWIGISNQLAITHLIEKIKELEEENRIFALEGSRVALKLHIEENYIPKQKVKGLLTEIQKEYEKLDKASDEFLSNEKKTVEDYILEKERLATMQTLAYCRDNLEELLEEK